MSPDFARLCDAVQIVCDHLGMPTETEDEEAIVRAVLTELREVSEETADAGRWPAEDAGPVACLRAMVDHILSGAA